MERRRRRPLTSPVKVALAAIALSFAAPIEAQTDTSWRAVDAETGKIADIGGLEALADAFPDSGSVRLRLLNAQINAGEADAALATLEWLQARGYVFSATAQAQIPRLIGEEHAEAAGALLVPEAQAIEASEVIATVPAEAGLIESVLAPENEELLVVSSITGNAIHIFVDGEWIAAPIPDASDLSGLVSEPDDSIGWVASANLDGSDDPEPLFTGLMGMRGDFSNPVLVPAPDGAAVSDLTIGPDATVYASDPLGGGIYKKPVGATQLEVLVPPGTFRSPQGLALSADGSRLYVSDYRYGLAVIDLVSGAVSRLASDVTAILDGVDGLWLHEGELIAVQNGTSPMRISAFALSGDGLRITGARTLEQSHPGWTEPLGGSIKDGALVYVATGQWDRFVKGMPADGKPSIPTQIRRLPLGKPAD